MNINTNKNHLFYILVGGLIFALLSGIINSIFVVELPIENNYILKCHNEYSYLENDIAALEYNVDKCIENKNPFEYQKMLYNNAHDNKLKIFIFEYILVLLGTFLYFYLFPGSKKERSPESEESKSNKVFLVFLLAFLIVGFVGPLWGKLIPSKNWPPKVFKDIHYDRVYSALESLKK